MIVLDASQASLAQALAVLQSGGVVIHATETCYGIACDLTNPNAVSKLFAIKKRPSDQPVSALFSSIEQAKQYVEWNDKAQKLAAKFLPGPLTIILPLKLSTPHQLYPHCPLSIVHCPLSIGTRLSSHPIAQQLVEAFGKPLSTTSANIHGLPEPYSVEEIIAQFEGQELKPDLLLDSGILPKQPPSTIVEIKGESYRIIRQGSIKP